MDLSIRDSRMCSQRWCKACQVLLHVPAAGSQPFDGSQHECSMLGLMATGKSIVFTMHLPIDTGRKAQTNLFSLHLHIDWKEARKIYSSLAASKADRME